MLKWVNVARFLEGTRETNGDELREAVREGSPVSASLQKSPGYIWGVIRRVKMPCRGHRNLRG
jgi:hypothetical protein